MDIDDDEIDDLDDIRKIMQETQRPAQSHTFISTYTESTTSEIVPFNPDVLDKNTVLHRPSMETSFRQPTTFSSTTSTAEPQYQSMNSSSVGGLHTDNMSGRPFTAMITNNYRYGEANLNPPSIKHSGFQTAHQNLIQPQHTFSTPLSTSMPESLFNSQPRGRPSTFGSDVSASNPMAIPSFSSSNRTESSHYVGGAPLFGKKVSSGSDFKSLSRNTSSSSYYNRQPASVFSSISSNTNSDYRFRPVDLPSIPDFNKPTFSNEADKQKPSDTVTSVSSHYPYGTQPNNKHDSTNNATGSCVSANTDNLTNEDDLNPTLLNLREGPPRPKTRPDTRPRSRPYTHIKHMVDEVRKSSEHYKPNDKSYNSSSSGPPLVEQLHSPGSNNREQSTYDTASSNERPLIYSPIPPVSSSSRVKSPISRFSLSSNVNPKMEARPLGLQAKTQSNSVVPNKMDKSGKIPKKSSHFKQKDDISSLKLLDLLSKKKEISNNLIMLDEDKKKIERKKSDIERNSRGSFYENDPQHRSLKDQLTSLNQHERELKSILDSIWDRLENQYSHKRTSIPVDRLITKTDSSKKSQSRPKMSTTPAGPIDGANRLEREQQLCSSQLNLDDGNNWCQVCDVHLKSLKEYCMHIHSESHSERTKNKTRPWTKVPTEFLTKGQTLEVIDKVIKSESDKKEANLSADEFKAIFDVSKYKPAKKQDKVDTSEHPEVVTESPSKPVIDLYRGQRFLIPITGAYCTLCDRGLFDESDVEYHMRSYEHIVAHTRMVFIDPHIESNYHRDMNRSLEKLKASKNNPNRFRYQENLQSLVEAREKRESDKKRRFIKEDETKRSLDKSKTSSPKFRKKVNIDTHESQESSPLNSPAKKKQNTSKDKVSESTRKLLSRELEISDDSDDENINSQSIMQHNDPTSLFPGLVLEVHGNTHTDLLLDKRLKQVTRVVMEKLDISNTKYAQMLSSENDLSRLDSSATLFNTIVKSEPFDWTLAKPTYFDKLGDQVPITLDSDTEDDNCLLKAPIKQEKPDKPSKESSKEISVKQEKSSEIENANVKKEKPPPNQKTVPEVVQLFSDDEEGSDNKINLDENLLLSCTDSEETSNPLPFTMTHTLTSRSMEFTSTIPEKNPNGTLNSIAINNDSSNDNLGGIIFDTKSDNSSPATRTSSPPLDNIIISNHSLSSNINIPNTIVDTSIEDQSISPTSITTISGATNVTESLNQIMTTTMSTSLHTPSIYSTPSCNLSMINQNEQSKIEDMDCGSSSLNFSHENQLNDSVNSLDVDDVDLGNNFQTPNLSDLSDPLVNTFTGDPHHLNSM